MLRLTISVISHKPEEVVASEKARATPQVAFESGKIGFKKNMYNPFHPKSDLYKEWERGYNTEYFDNLKRVYRFSRWQLSTKI
jgi:hypothetical protein